MKLASKYKNSFQFKLDIISLIPFDLIALIFTQNATIFRLNRLLRINRLLETRLKIETRFPYPFFIRIIYLVFLIIIMIHWNACFYFILSNRIGIDSDSWVYNTQLSALNSQKEQQVKLENKMDMFIHQYIYCFFWSIMMLTTIGEVNTPESTLESNVMIINFLLAIVLVATLVGNIGSVIANMKIEQVQVQQRVDAIKNLMKKRKVSKELEKRIVKWFSYLHKNKKTTDAHEIMLNLPEQFRISVASNVYLDILKKVNIFTDCEEGLLRELVTKLTLQVYSPGDYVCRKGDIGKEMFIIKNGMLNVVSDDSKTVFVTLNAGSFFGEISILNIPGNITGNRRTANVRSVGYSELLLLSKNDLWNSLKDYPSNRKMIIEKGKVKLIKDKLLDEAKEKKAYKLTKRFYKTELEQIELETQLNAEFAELMPEDKLENVLLKFETQEKYLEQLHSDLIKNCEKSRNKIEYLKFLNRKKIGVSV